MTSSTSRRAASERRSPASPSTYSSAQSRLPALVQWSGMPGSVSDSSAVRAAIVGCSPADVLTRAMRGVELQRGGQRAQRRESGADRPGRGVGGGQVVAVGDDQVTVDVAQLQRPAATAHRGEGGEGSVGGRVRAAGVLAARLTREGQRRLQEGPRRTDQLAGARRAHRERYAHLTGARALDPLLGYLRVLGVVPAAPRCVDTPVERLLADYRAYLVRERGLVAGSVRLRERVARMFSPSSRSRSWSRCMTFSPRT
jgi:hypothetical protein